MLNVSIKKYRYIFLALLLLVFPKGIALAHGWGPLILFGDYGLMVGILGAFVFSALSRKSPVLSSVAGMLFGMAIVAIVVSIMMGSPLDGVTSIFIFGGMNHIVPGVF